MCTVKLTLCVFAAGAPGVVAEITIGVVPSGVLDQRTPRPTGKLICTICYISSDCEWMRMHRKRFGNSLS